MATNEAQRTARRFKVLDLRLAGATYRQILTALQEEPEPFMHVKSPATVKNDEAVILDAMREDKTVAAERHRVLVHERYESLFLRWYPIAIGSTTEAYKATEMCRRLLDDIRQLWGLDPNVPLVSIRHETNVETNVLIVDTKETLRDRLLRLSDTASRNRDENHANNQLNGSMEIVDNGLNGTNGDNPGGEA